MSPEESIVAIRGAFPEIYFRREISVEVVNAPKRAKTMTTDEYFPLKFSVSLDDAGNGKIQVSREPDSLEIFWLFVALGKLIARRRWGSDKLFIGRVFSFVEGTEFDLPRLPW